MKKLIRALLYWWNPPATMQPGKTKRPNQYRPIPIELGFRLDADGKVYFRSRRHDGDRRIDNPEIIEWVHSEYRYLVAEAKRRHQFDMLRRKLHAVVAKSS